MRAEFERLAETDPIRRQAEMGFEQNALSPMAPPDAFAPPAGEQVPREELHPFLRALAEEHEVLSRGLAAAEAAVKDAQEKGYTRETNAALVRLLTMIEEDFQPHSRREEQALFPLLAARLMDAGEHSQASTRTTAVDVMLDDHLRANQLAAAIAAYMGLLPRISDPASRKVIAGSALREVMSLVELLRLHAFREDRIVFAAAHRRISGAELGQMGGGS